MWGDSRLEDKVFRVPKSTPRKLLVSDGYLNLRRKTPLGVRHRNTYRPRKWGWVWSGHSNLSKYPMWANPSRSTRENVTRFLILEMQTWYFTIFTPRMQSVRREVNSRHSGSESMTRKTHWEHQQHRSYWSQAWCVVALIFIHGGSFATLCLWSITRSQSGLYLNIIAWPQECIHHRRTPCLLSRHLMHAHGQPKRLSSRFLRLGKQAFAFLLLPEIIRWRRWAIGPTYYAIVFSSDMARPISLH
jgi:hypothetical protein